MFNFIKAIKNHNQSIKEIEKRIIDIKNSDIKHFDIIDDKAIIYLDLTNNDNIYVEGLNHKILKQEIYDYLDNTYEIVKKCKHIEIEIKANEDSDFIIELIRNKYALDYAKYKKAIKRNNIASFIMLMVGISLLTCNVLLDYFDKNIIINEVIDIFAWVFVWESCDMFAFTKLNNRLDLVRSLRLFKAQYSAN